MNKRLHPSKERWYRNHQEQLQRHSYNFYSDYGLQCIEPEMEKILRKNQNFFRRNWPTTSQIAIINHIRERVHAKNLEATHLFVYFSKVFHFIYRGKREQIHRAYGLTKETVTALMMFSRNTKVKVRSPDGDNLLRHCCWSSARSYINIIYVHILPWLRS